MRKLLRWTIILGILGAAAWGVSGPFAAYWKERNRVRYREAEVSRGRIVAVVNATGTVKPVLLVSVGSFVSGPIEEIFVDFNDEVKKDQVLARVDPRIYKANQARDQATLATRQADVKQVEAKLKQARRDEERGKALRAENKDFVAIAEMDKLTFEREALEAALEVAKSSVEQAQANLDQSKANVAYTEIRSPVSGVIINRKIDPGQTMAAQFQTPELFIVAPDLRDMRVFASVDEADIGLIHEAQQAKQPVHFTVDAWPDLLFEGKILQIRMNSTTTQNVVTYPVVIEAPNPDLKLKPDMTATISFQLREKDDVLLLVILDVVDAYAREIPRALEGLDDPIDRLVATVDAYCRVVDKRRAATVLAYRSTKSLSPGRRRLIQDRELETNQMIARAIGDCIRARLVRKINVDVLTYQIVLIAHGWALKHWHFGRVYSLDDYIRLQTRFVLNTVLPQTHRTRYRHLLE